MAQIIFRRRYTETVVTVTQTGCSIIRKEESILANLVLMGLILLNTYMVI
jgi:hypothetical protein